ncbi:head-tail connector protein [Vibrio parahaemolyticus]|uniref:head-tail connector protein n=1 Tax=Vibrio parahaemolyticus TaxID=670 RepID=UPI0005F228A1|nr:head-tail connector protein [Vibrio parahaemolyticus]KJR15242.1 hypothetical protein UF28_16380 [Vibrio parahaemolyticus]
MHYKIISKNSISEAILPTEEIMDYLRVYDFQEEPLISLYREAAIEFTEAYTNRILGSGEVYATFKNFKKEVYLPLTPTEVASVHAWNKSNERVKITSYRLNSISDSLVFTQDLSGLTDFEVHYLVSYGEQSTPNALKIGMLKLIATWYENREDISNGVSVQEIPMNHKHVFDLFRLPPTGE